MANPPPVVPGSDTTWRAVFTIVLFVMAFVVLIVVLITIPSVPIKDAKGNVLVDMFVRSKDILLVVLPLVTTALGFWFGAQGKQAAEKKADDAKSEAATAQAQVAALIAAGGGELRTKVEASNPRLFSP